MARNAKNMTPQAVECTNYYVKIMDWDANGNLIYYGKADPGTATSASGWLITKLTYDASNQLTNIQTEGGNTTYDAVWDDRTSLSYS